MEKKGKENKINISKNYSIVSGTIDITNPKSLYVNISAWGQPKLTDKMPYGKIIKHLHKTIKQKLYNNINKNKFIDNRIIVDLDMRESGVKFGRRSFLNCEVTLYQKDEMTMESDELKNELVTVADLIVNNVLENNEYFSFYRTKK